MKIGELVKSKIHEIFQYCLDNDIEELKRLKDKVYSNKIFGINFPFCSKVEVAADDSRRYWKETYKVNGELLRVSSQWNFRHTIGFLNYLRNCDIITEKDLYDLNVSVQESYKEQGNIQSFKTKVETQVLSKENYSENPLIKEANFMSIQYQKFYCLERSIRELIRVNLEEKHGSEWWSTLDDAVKRNVETNLRYELDTTHTKRSQHNIDYTTFGDLRKIINSNWNQFESLFNRNLSSVNEVMIDLNRLRVPIAHCTPLAAKEIKRLEIRIDDWNQLLSDR